ncbi:Alkylated DNA repair dioxygenase AlkB [Raineyella antarctica]|uniref:Alkylated DNA repair dioxygenase AlkB n=1 Tax=Raineyella antarctica TaxID=1577474 RepID=A0A1G6HCV2_9ACTN|nr:alpha-ketoglutarate-dependent dioxygenase AlkB [Raineyella antarctica]SDB91983.1 Alkylated DNA repair dioxygenase AlkB [Raineyella antarctica]
MLQPSLLDLSEAPAVGDVRRGRVRHPLAEGAWIDLRRGWLGGSDVLFDALATTVDWRAERRQMYDAVVDVPRLTRFYGGGEELPHPVLEECRVVLNESYGGELGEDFVTVGLCLYRGGRDSVAWHGDRVGRSRTQDTMVAIVSVGEPRPLMLRPRGGGSSIAVPLGHGDLIVMGGSCQRTWDHCIPKTERPVGPRISIQFRPQGVL